MVDVSAASANRNTVKDLPLGPELEELPTYLHFALGTSAPCAFVAVLPEKSQDEDKDRMPCADVRRLRSQAHTGHVGREVVRIGRCRLGRCGDHRVDRIT